MFFLLWFSPTVSEGRLWERLGIYSVKLFIAVKPRFLTNVTTSGDVAHVFFGWFLK